MPAREGNRRTGREGGRSGTNTANVTRLTRGKGGREGDSRRKGFTPRDPSCCHLQRKLPETELHRVANQIREKVYGIPKFPRPTPWPAAASVDVVRDTSSACIGHAPSSQRCCKKRARMRQRSDEARAGEEARGREANKRPTELASDRVRRRPITASTQQCPYPPPAAAAVETASSSCRRRGLLM